MHTCTNETHSLANAQDLIPTLAGITSLSMVVLNSRDRQGNVWLL